MDPWTLFLFVTITSPFQSDGIIKYGTSFATEDSCRKHIELMMLSANDVAASMIPEGFTFRNPHFECKQEKLGEPV